jgi:glycosyltransferase involved in cell wall biosynthesis
MTLEIVQIVQELSTMGGAETVALGLAKAFRRAGVPNSVVASTVDEAACSKITVDRIAPWMARIPTRGFLGHIGRLIVVPLFTIMATRAVRRHPRAVVVSHGDSLRGDVLVVHAVNAESLAEKRRAGSWRWILNPMHIWIGLRDRWMIGGLRYRMFVAVSARVSAELQRHYKVPARNIRVIPNGIDLDHFQAEPALGRAIRQEFGIPEDARVLLFVGHEFDRKGLTHAINALELLEANVWLLVVGADNQPPYRKLAKHAGGRLVFAGARGDMPAFYAAADGFILPTSYETFSLVCMEAMACAVPVFATSAGGIEDYLQNGVNGFMITTDPQDIAAKIRRVFSDETLLQQLRTGARRTAASYGWDDVASKYIQLARELHASGGAVQACEQPPSRSLTGNIVN